MAKRQQLFHLVSTVFRMDHQIVFVHQYSAGELLFEESDPQVTDFCILNLFQMSD